jgi:subtilisin family serine protease/photosystem II stability/assembly factor-like uncharacterized protein
MRLAVPLLALLIACAVTFDGTAKERPRPATPPASTSADIVPGMLFIKLKQIHDIPAGATAIGLSGVDRILARAKTTSIEPLHRTMSLRKSFASREEQSIARIMKVRFDASIDVHALTAELAGDPAVEYAEPYYSFRPLHTPDDPRLSTQWAIQALEMEDAWDITQGDSTIVIGFVDTGINYNHEDLTLSIYINPGEWGVNGELSNNGIDDDNNGFVDDWRGWDFIGNGTVQEPNADNDPMDFNGHGTNAAGISSATTNNGRGIAGIGYHSKVLPIKVQDDAGQSSFAGYDGILYAADMGCHVINCSWGSHIAINQTMQDIIDYAHSKGSLVVAGAGNDVNDTDENPFLPASLNHVLSVSSFEEDGSFSEWAARGASVHVAAPGSNVLTTRGSFGYTNVTGTSFAAPHVSGLAALMFALRPDWTPAQVKQQIRVTSEAFDGMRSAKRYGRANAYKALSMNDSLDEIPGVLVESAAVIPPNGFHFTEGGEVATLEVTFKNVLAPTDNAMVELILDDVPISADVTSYTLGAMFTNETRMLTMQVRLDDDVLLSEGYIPVILKITDASYEDYVVVRAPIYLDDGWHTVVDLRYPYSSIDMTDRWTIWLSGNFTENNVPVQDIALRSTDGGDQWMFAFGQGFPSGRGVYCIEGIDDMTALVGTGPVDGNAAIARTTDGGENWSSASVANFTPFVNWIHMFDAQNGLMQGDPRNNFWGIATTTDGGSSWIALSAPVSAADTEAGWNNSYDVVGDHVWFGTNSSIIYRSTDRGQTWAPHAVPSKNSVDMSFRDEMVGVARFSMQGEQGTDTLALTTDGGLNWSLISTIAAPGGTVIFERGGKRLWYFQQGNAFVSTDLGESWGVQPTPMDFDFIRDATGWNDGFVTSIFAAGIEIFRYNSDFMLDVEEIAHTTAATPLLHPLYPNPVGHDATVTARLSLPTAARVLLAVYDMSGKKVREVLSATLHAGGHQAQVSTAGLPAGNYLLRMSTDDFSSTQKLIVLN